MRKGRALVLLALWLLASVPASALQSPPREPVSPVAYTGIWFVNDNWYGVAVVDRVDPNSPADVAGVQKNDRIVAVVFESTVYSYYQALKRIPADGVWTGPRWAYGPDERVVELIIRRPLKSQLGLFEGGPEAWDSAFETVVVMVRWAAKAP